MASSAQPAGTGDVAHVLQAIKHGYDVVVLKCDTLKCLFCDGRGHQPAACTFFRQMLAGEGKTQYCYNCGVLSHGVCKPKCWITLVGPTARGACSRCYAHAYRTTHRHSDMKNGDAGRALFVLTARAPLFRKRFQALLSNVARIPELATFPAEFGTWASALHPTRPATHAVNDAHVTAIFDWLLEPMPTPNFAGYIKGALIFAMYGRYADEGPRCPPTSFETRFLQPTPTTPKAPTRTQSRSSSQGSRSTAVRTQSPSSSAMSAARSPNSQRPMPFRYRSGLAAPVPKRQRLHDLRRRAELAVRAIDETLQSLGQLKQHVQQIQTEASMLQVEMQDFTS